MKAHRIIAFAAALAIVGWTIPATGYAQKATFAASEVETSGACGENLTWEYDSDARTLSINGTGEMSNWEVSSYNSEDNFYPPWRDLIVTKVEIAEGVTSIGDGAFAGLHIENVILPASIIRIGEYSFFGCAYMKTISFGNSVEYIGKNAFFCCYELEELILPDSIKNIEHGAFSACSSLATIVLPNSLKEISDYVFFGCEFLERVTIPESVESIAEEAFSACRLIKSIVIPASVKSIGDNAFIYCNKMQSIYFINPDCLIFDRVSVIPSNAIIYGYEGSTAQSYAEKYGRQFEIINENPVTEMVWGDANESGEVNMADAVFIMRCQADPDEFQMTEQGKKNADVIGNDGVTNGDALAIQQFEAGIVENLPIS